MSPAYLLLGALLLLAAGWDVAQRRVPNPLVLCGLVFGPALTVYEHGWGQLLPCILGAALAFALTFPQWRLKLMGGGDAKLFMVCGAFLGPATVVDVLLYALVAHGLVSLAVLLIRRVQAMTGWTLVQDTLRVPMAVAVPVGALLALIEPLLAPALVGLFERVTG